MRATVEAQRQHYRNVSFFCFSVQPQGLLCSMVRAEGHFIYSDGCIMVWHGPFYRNESIENQTTIKPGHSSTQQVASTFWRLIYLYKYMYTHTHNAKKGSSVFWTCNYCTGLLSALPALTMRLDRPAGECGGGGRGVLVPCHDHRTGTPVLTPVQERQYWKPKP